MVQQLWQMCWCHDAVSPGAALVSDGVAKTVLHVSAPGLAQAQHVLAKQEVYSAHIVSSMNCAGPRGPDANAVVGMPGRSS